MRAILDKSTVSGTVTPPASKSYTIRSIIAAGMADGRSVISNPLHADDTMAAVDVLNNLGANILQKNNCYIVDGGNLSPSDHHLDCRDSAATLRFMTAVCATFPAESHLLAGPSLAKRPIKPLMDILSAMGACLKVENRTVTVSGGQLKGGLYEINNDESSQFISALLLMSPLLKQQVVYQLSSPPRSRPYIEMTIETLRQFGVNVIVYDNATRFSISPQNFKPASISIEADWSSASYLIALGALCGDLHITGINLLSLQGDKIIVALLKKMGALILLDRDSITVRQSELNGITADMSQCIDLVPTVAVLAAVANGVTRLNGIARARLKESNRVSALCEGLERTGIKIKQSSDSLEIHGGSPRKTDIDSFNDHRIAMAFGILGLKTGNLVINNAECVSKTYPAFWPTIKTLNGKVRLVDE